ncbi:MAG: APC family permease [Gemmatimonadota bacterium]|nr:APC family permease [Gemmatimonadota bacterium]
MKTSLVRAIGRWSLAALMLNGVIGSSVFGLPSVIAGKLGALSPWAWIVAAAGIGVVIACFAEVASRFGEAGGPYLYARTAFGRLAGIEMGWMAYLVRLTAAATNANLLVIYLAELWPAAEGPLASRLVLAGLIAPLAVINYRGVIHGTRISTLTVAAKLTPLILFVLLGLALALPHPVTPAMITVIEPNAWLDAVLLLVFAYGGFEAALVPLGEARDPRRDAPFALFLVLAICAVLYTLVQVVVIATLPDPAAAARPLAASARVIAGSAGAITMAVAAVISVYGYIAGAMVNVPRLTFAMAEGGDLPSPFARIHPRFRTPHLSVVTYAVLVWGLAASGSFLQNLSLSAVSRLVTYGMVCAALPVLRGRDRGAGSAALPLARFRLPGGVLWAVLGIAFSLTLSTRMTQQEFLVLSATGLLGLLNWLWVRRTSR